MTKYQKRISGPLLARIDIHVEVPRVGYQKLSEDRLGAQSQATRARVERARELQTRRFAGESDSRLSNSRSSDSSKAKFDAGSVVCNADMQVAPLRGVNSGAAVLQAGCGGGEPCAGGDGADEPLGAWLSPGAEAGVRYRAIADLAACENIRAVHLAEAVQYRPRVM